MELIALTGSYAVAQYAKPPALPQGFQGLMSLSVAPGEVSLICPEDALPEGYLRREGGWRALRVAGSMAFSMVGVMAALSRALADGGVSLLALSTYDTDYLLVKQRDWPLAVSLLTQAGHSFL